MSNIYYIYIKRVLNLVRTQTLVLIIEIHQFIVQFFATFDTRLQIPLFYNDNHYNHLHCDVFNCFHVKVMRVLLFRGILIIGANSF